jgi:hypothetical protein
MPNLSSLIQIHKIIISYNQNVCQNCILGL